MCFVEHEELHAALAACGIRSHVSTAKACAAPPCFAFPMWRFQCLEIGVSVPVATSAFRRTDQSVLLLWRFADKLYAVVRHAESLVSRSGTTVLEWHPVWGVRENLDTWLQAAVAHVLVLT